MLLASPGGCDVVAYDGMTLTELRDVADVGLVDISIVPGTIDVGAAIADEVLRWVEEGSIVTSGGLTSGMHMALHLVARDYGADHAVRTTRQLNLAWDPSGAS